MALETKLEQRLSQQLVMTPQLRQAIKILQVSRPELEQLVEEELAENPVLEETTGLRDEAEESAPRTEERLETVGGDTDWTVTADQRETTNELEPESGLKTIDWGDYLDNYSNDWHGASATAVDYDDERPSAAETTVTRRQSLSESLLWQLQMNELDPREESVTALLVGNLDKDGYLQVPIENIAFQTGKDYDVGNRALHRIQEFDPPGVGARNLRECLLLQLRTEGQEQSLVAMIVRDYLDLLEGKRFDKIARELDVRIEEVVVAAGAIGMLEPKPGRNFGDGDVRYITPDVFAQKVGDEYIVTLNEEGLPRLRVSSYYRRVLGGGDGGDAKRYIQERMRAAAWLIKSIQQRQRTLYLVASSIVKFQREFLELGVAHLKPLVLRDVAVDSGMHESTVSRATANKYIHTSQGLFELKYFFTSGLRGADGDDVSVESVKDRIRTIISAEDSHRPLSDQRIVRILAEEHVDVARRTVARYREMLGILSSSKRRQLY